mgnify:CR=1 FL=1
MAVALKNSKTFSKPVRLAALYQASAICLKATTCLVQGLENSVELGDSGDELAEQELAAVEVCLANLLPARTPKTADPSAATSDAESPDSESGTVDTAEVLPPTLRVRVWDALLLSFAALKECRRLDAFDFKSVYRIARGVEDLARIICCADGDCIPTGVHASLLELLNMREISDECALEEMSKLFDRKRSQIVAMWCVENAVSPWEKVRETLY